MKKTSPTLPKAPGSIEKGVPLKDIVSPKSIRCLTENIQLVHPNFPGDRFEKLANTGLKAKSILQRGHHVAKALHETLPSKYADAVDILIRSLTPPWAATDKPGLAVFFYLPHTSFVANYGLDPRFNAGRDPFQTSMDAQYELTKRFTAEFSIRPFLIQRQSETLKILKSWLDDEDHNIRRLCTEGTRPRLPWAMRIPEFVNDPRPALPILEALKDDSELYVRRSVANHLADIAKDHKDLALEICERWLKDASPERRWVIRHALRYPAKKGDKKALKVRALAK